MRPLKLEKALEVVDYVTNPKAVIRHPEPAANGVANIARSPYFTANVLQLDHAVQRDYAPLDSFVAFMCVEGACAVKALDADNEDAAVTMRVGEAVLIPASLNDIVLDPQGHCKLRALFYWKKLKCTLPYDRVSTCRGWDVKSVSLPCSITSHPFSFKRGKIRSGKSSIRSNA